jgi:hypothetical protein
MIFQAAAAAPESSVRGELEHYLRFGPDIRRACTVIGKCCKCSSWALAFPGPNIAGLLSYADSNRAQVYYISVQAHTCTPSSFKFRTTGSGKRQSVGVLFSILFPFQLPQFFDTGAPERAWRGREVTRYQYSCIRCRWPTAYAQTHLGSKLLTAGLTFTELV